MSEVKYILTVSAGGSRSSAAFWTMGGDLLSRARGVPISANTDLDTVFSVIEVLWSEMPGVVGLDRRAGKGEVAVSLALPGMGIEAKRARIRDELATFRTCRISSDSYASLIGAFGGGPGAILLVEAGTAACRINDRGDFQTFSGWGFPGGDRGGGAWLGAQLVADYLEFVDGTSRVGKSVLFELLSGQMGKDRPTILNFLHAATFEDFAALAPSIVEAAKSGDAEGLDLIAAAVDELERLAKRVRGDPPLRLQIAGSLGRMLRPWLGLEESEARPSPHRGAYLIATGEVAAEFADDRTNCC